jgi:hypothetical protein
MKSVSQIFEGNEHLMDLGPVEELIEYTQELEGMVFENKMEEPYNKEHIYISMLQDILTSCLEMEENNLLHERWPDIYKKTDAEDLVKNLKDYIIDMNRTSRLGL